MDLLSVYKESAWLVLQHPVFLVYPKAWVLLVPCLCSPHILQHWGSPAHLTGPVTERDFVKGGTGMSTTFLFKPR